MHAVHSPWRGVEISSLSSPHVNMSISNHSTTRKSWRSDAPIILPGWECHTGGSRSKPTVHRCRPKTGGCGLLTRTQDEPTKQHAATQYAQFALSITFFQLFLHVDAVVYLCHSHLTSITVLTAVWAQACGLESKTPLSLSCIFGHSHPRHFRFVCIRVRDISCLFVGEVIAVSLY